MNKFLDNRGKLIFPIKENMFDFKQCTVSINKKDVFRGVHINQFDKLVTCISGKILDIIVNMNELTEDYLIPQYYNLDCNTDLFQILIPAGYGHCFLSLEENSILLYHFNGIFTDQNTKHIHYSNLNIQLPIENPIMSIKDNIKSTVDYLVFGYKGFIGSCIVDQLKKENKSYICSNVRLQNISEIIRILDLYKPKYLINCAGITGTPNIMWCEDHKEETIDNNITRQIEIADLCLQRNIHLTILGSGAIFDSLKYYTEEDIGNFTPNFYTQCRIELEGKIKLYPNVLYLRINYPISSKQSPKNLLTKLLSYKTINDISLSITCLDSLIPLLFQMIENNEIGICNFVNTGEISLVEIVKLFRKDEFQISTSIDITRSFPKLTCNKLEKYGVDNILKSLKNFKKNIIKWEKK